MKNVKNSKNQIKRVSNNVAERLVTQGWKYGSNTEWRNVDKTAIILPTEQVSVAKKTNKNKKIKTKIVEETVTKR